MLPRYRCTDARDRSGRRMIDANAGAPNEWPPTPRTAGGVPIAGGVKPEEVFAADRRRIRISGRDQESGEHFGAERTSRIAGEVMDHRRRRHGTLRLAMRRCTIWKTAIRSVSALGCAPGSGRLMRTMPRAEQCTGYTNGR